MSIEIIIDGITCTCEPGEYLAAIAARNGIHIPTLCASNDALLGRGCCRVCIVEIIEAGRTSVVVSCIYPVKQPIEVFTTSARIIKERGVILALLACLAPDSERIAEMAREYNAPVLKDPEPDTDKSKCILCGLCVEACKTLGAEAISTVGRGVEKKIATPYEEVSAYCIGCASCAFVCPTNSIEVHTTDTSRTIWDREFTIVRCEVCGEVIGTTESLAYAHTCALEQKEPEEVNQALCSVHKRQQMAGGLVGL